MQEPGVGIQAGLAKPVRGRSCVADHGSDNEFAREPDVTLIHGQLRIGKGRLLPARLRYSVSLTMEHCDESMRQAIPR